MVTRKGKEDIPQGKEMVFDEDTFEKCKTTCMAKSSTISAIVVSMCDMMKEVAG